jgi:hypothetical protein
MLSPKGEKKISIANGEGEFDQNVFILGKNFKTKYKQFLRCTMEANVLWF